MGFVYDARTSLFETNGLLNARSLTAPVATEKTLTAMSFPLSETVDIVIGSSRSIGAAGRRGGEQREKLDQGC